MTTPSSSAENRNHATKEWHSLRVNDVLDILGSNINGLSSDEAERRLAVYGGNKISEERGRSPATIMVKQLRESLIIILLVATAISIVQGEIIGGIIITVIVILSAIVGFVQEFRSEKAIEALKKMASATPRAKG